MEMIKCEDLFRACQCLLILFVSLVPLNLHLLNSSNQVLVCSLDSRLEDIYTPKQSRRHELATPQNSLSTSFTRPENV